MGDGGLDPDELQKASVQYGELTDEIDETTMRWMELAEKEQE